MSTWSPSISAEPPNPMTPSESGEAFGDGGGDSGRVGEYDQGGHGGRGKAERQTGMTHREIPGWRRGKSLHRAIPSWEHGGLTPRAASPSTQGTPKPEGRRCTDRSTWRLPWSAGLMAAATPALAQTGTTPKPPAPADSGRRMKDPISRMLEQRDQLKLTDDQVRRLEQIRTKYQEKYKDHLEQMRRSREARSALRAGMDSARAEVAGGADARAGEAGGGDAGGVAAGVEGCAPGRHHGGAHGKHDAPGGDSKDG